MVTFSVKSLIYKELQPVAQSLGCQLLLLDKKTYQSYSSNLEKKMKILGIEVDQYDKLVSDIEWYGCIAVLKSTKYYGAPEIASAFSSIGLKTNDVQYLNSVEAKKHKIWGDLDATIPEHKRKFFYWFIVSVEDVNGERIMEDVDKLSKRHTQINSTDYITVKDFIDAINNVAKTQSNEVVNFAPENNGYGKIYGQINDIFLEKRDNGTYCILTLAPYKNGSRSMDCSIDKSKQPMTLVNIYNILSDLPSNTPILIRYKDPLAFGPKIGQITEVPIDNIDVDKLMGMFLRSNI